MHLYIQIIIIIITYLKRLTNEDIIFLFFLLFGGGLNLTMEFNMLKYLCKLINKSNRIQNFKICVSK